MRLGKVESVGIAFFCEPVDYRTSRVTEAQHLGALVEGLADGIVYGLTEYFEVQRRVHPDYLGVASLNQQAQIREGGFADRLPLLAYESGQDVSLKVVDHYHWHFQRQAESFGEGSSHK